MNEQQLREMQESIVRQIGHKVDVYYNENSGVVGVFHHNTPPTPATLIQLIHC
ncbi:hypothetical protein OB446_026980 [Paenibacillus alvei]|uniref:hypothetical protein n=1 Tax=Paenibacillus alvei TaxID=44250 RepID=UPI0002893C4B|nr:hypothetical protein [Paenibacillus alvei]EJW13920.1 hypothetical protein PAV_141p00260 [Paenibacillus alvei DSM 29]MCY9707716.1 hypothetical protein [Paenibacillus alvei]MEC0082771.1 hypothetical protein [Paenibacillus alvei]